VVGRQDGETRKEINFREVAMSPIRVRLSNGREAHQLRSNGTRAGNLLHKRTLVYSRMAPVSTTPNANFSTKKNEQGLLE